MVEEFLFRSKLGKAILLIGFLFSIYKGAAFVLDRLDRKTEELTATFHINEYLDVHIEIVKTGTGSFVLGMPSTGAGNFPNIWPLTAGMGFIRVDLENTGNTPIKAIKVRVANTFKYALASRGFPEEIEADEKGAAIGDLAPGDRATVFVWTQGIKSLADVPEAERGDIFKVTHDKGLARTVFVGESFFAPYSDLLGRIAPVLLIFLVLAVAPLVGNFQITRRPPKKK